MLQPSSSEQAPRLCAYYKAGPPVVGEDFYDRSDLVANVTQNLADRENGKRHFLLIGTRRIGKTSILKELKRRAMKGVAGQPFICLEWNMQGKQTPDDTRGALLTPFQVRNLRRRFPLIPWADLRETPCLAELLDEICRLAEREYGHRVLLTIDEPEPLEVLAARVQAGDALETERRWLENVQQMINEVDALACVCAAPPTTATLFTAPLNPLEAFELSQLRPLPREEALQLIYLDKRREGLGISRAEADAFLGGDEGVALILAASGRIPFLIQSICRELCNNPSARGADRPKSAFKSLCSQAVFDQTFVSYFKEFSTLQKLIMLEMARSGEIWEEQRLSESDVAGQISHIYPSASTRVGQQLQELERLQVLVAKFDEAGNPRYRVAFTLFGEWMRRSLSARWSEVLLEARTDPEANANPTPPPPPLVNRSRRAPRSEASLDDEKRQLLAQFKGGEITRDRYLGKLERVVSRSERITCGIDVENSHQTLAAQLFGVETTLGELRAQYHRGDVTDNLYFKKLRALSVDQHLLRADLDAFLRARDAVAVADTLAVVSAGKSDDEVAAQLERTTTLAKAEPQAHWAAAWLSTVGDRLHANRGQFVELAVSGAIAVAKRLL